MDKIEGLKGQSFCTKVKKAVENIPITVILLFLGIMAGSASAATWTVDDSNGANFTRIQDAINNATAGDTIQVYSGIYYENVNVDKQLTLLGIGMPVVDARGSRSAITLSANGITLEGFTATGGGPSGDLHFINPYPEAGIKITSDNNTLSSNNARSNNWFGIYLSASSNNTLRGNNASSNNYTGISLQSSSNNMLIGNTASNNSVEDIVLYSDGDIVLYRGGGMEPYLGGGIVLSSSSNNNLNGNTASNNSGAGIYLSCWSNEMSCSSSSNNNTLSGNTASNNSGAGIYLSSWRGNNLLSSFSNNNLSGNTASNNPGAGIVLYYSSNNTLHSNIMTGNTYNFDLNGGVSDSDFNNQIDTSNLVDGKPIYYIKDVSNAIYGSSINAGTLYCISCVNVTIKEMNLTKNGVGIFLWNTTGSKIQNITALNNRGGIVLSSSSNNNLSGNTASYNYGRDIDYNKGIALIYYSNNNMLSGNNASNNREGIILYYSSNNNTLSNNTVFNNWYGIGQGFSSNNTLRGNMMTGNTYNFDLQGGPDSDFNNQIDTSNLVDGRPIYYIKNASNAIYDSSINAGTLYCISCVNVTIKDMNLNKNGAGIFLWNTTGSRIQNITALNHYHGIFLDSSSNNKLSSNNASNNREGIILYYSSNNTLSNNNAANNNYTGIFLMSSNNNMLNGNNASKNDLSVYERFYGISLRSSSNNTIYNNYFSNTNNAFDDGNNIWNITKTQGTNIIGGSWLGGNYWSDYTGNDTDGDGLGDTFLPYNSSGRIANGGDYLPLRYVSTANPGAPNITSFSPNTSTVTNNVGESRTFSISTNQTVNVNWLINGTDVFNETGVITSSYTNSIAELGTWNVTAVANNNNGTAMQTWDWNVTSITNNNRVHNINKGTSYKTIQAAIDDANPGDEIHVDSGIYFENVNVNKQLTLRGIGMPAVDARGSGSAITLAADGITLEGFTAMNASVTNYPHAGIKVNSNNNIIKTNKASKNYHGIWLDSSSNSTLRGNNASNNDFGIYLSSSNNNIFNGNNASSNNYNGILLSSSSDNTLGSSNTSFNNQHGIYLHYSSNNILNGNDANSNKFYGIFLDFSNNNTLISNKVNLNYNIGILMLSSSNNTIYHNNFINNANQAFDTVFNSWDSGYPTGGNYWSDYNGTDANSDSIGDTPYNISGDSGAQDRYPYMRENGWITTNNSPVADCGPDKLRCENVKSPVQFNASSSYDPDGTIVSYNWDFGDGTNATGVTPVHKYSTYRWNGTLYQPFTVNLTVKDNDGMTNSTSQKVVIWIAGDANGDGKVNILDASLVGLKWNSNPADPCADLNNDGKVNILDASIIGIGWGKIPVIR